jgi:hypothetical protein
MDTFRSPEVIVNKSAENLFDEISDLNNLKNIMPSAIKDFKSTETSCSFKMQGMPELTLKITEKTKFSKISLTAIDSQAPFTLDCLITEKGEQCQAKLVINAELNMMMKMMIEKPLNRFLDVLANKMQNL